MLHKLTIKDHEHTTPGGKALYEVVIGRCYATVIRPCPT